MRKLIWKEVPVRNRHLSNDDSDWKVHKRARSLIESYWSTVFSVLREQHCTPPDQIHVSVETHTNEDYVFGNSTGIYSPCWNWILTVLQGPLAAHKKKFTPLTHSCLYVSVLFSCTKYMYTHCNLAPIGFFNLKVSCIIDVFSVMPVKYYQYWEFIYPLCVQLVLKFLCLKLLSIF